ncbi:hypothetical protein [Altericista sp. CCNU0014]|uniref:hypothetical protein n=1 Tax=Altericista sp. CCNU0014 TaxID=3082949 RepID=UPI003850BA7C
MRQKAAIAPLPSDYESRSAAEKKRYLWNERILPSRYQTLPPLTRIDAIGLFFTALRVKMDLKTDQVPQSWKKAIHAHGVVAQAKFLPSPNVPFTGLFQGAEHCLVRLSLTGDPAARGFAPGLALKLLIDGKPSENFSALVSLAGQGKNYNFFANEMSNIVPVVSDFGPRLINWIFERVTRFPTKLYLQDLAKVDRNGNPIETPYFPYQIFLVPNPSIQFPETPDRDFREDLSSIPAESLLYRVYAVDPQSLEADPETAAKIVDRKDYRQQAREIGQLMTTSEFVASEYGDNFLFFRHQRFGNR